MQKNGKIMRYVINLLPGTPVNTFKITINA
jgi:hypothetical protein